MPFVNMKAGLSLKAGLILIAGAALNAPGRPAMAQEIITLTQTPCQFIEAEGRDLGFTSQAAADCEKINAGTGTERLAKARTLRLKPGEYIFRVMNKNVPYDLGFWIRERDYDWRNPLHKVSKISVSGGGLAPGTTKDYKVALRPGEYFYSCPLNPTPNYRIVVEE